MFTHMAPTGGCMNRLPKVLVLNVCCSVIIQKELGYTVVSIGGCNVKLDMNKREKRIKENLDNRKKQFIF